MRARRSRYPRRWGVAGLRAEAQSLQRAGERELLFLMHGRGCYKVTGNGVAFKLGGVRLTYTVIVQNRVFTRVFLAAAKPR